MSSGALDARLKDAIKKAAKDFERDGFACVENFLTEEEVMELRDESTRLIYKALEEQKERPIFTPKLMSNSQYYIESGEKVSFFYEEKAFDPKTNELVVPKEESLAKIAHALHYPNKVFRKATTSEKVKAVYKEIGYKDPTIVQSMVIFKNPKVGHEYTPHQDASYLTTDPVHVVGIWFALDDATATNGCLDFIPGSHKWPLARRFVRASKDLKDPTMIWTSPPVEYDESKFVPAEVKRGGMVLIDGLVVHRSAPNSSDKSRWIYTFHAYDKSRCEFLKDCWNQPVNVPEVFMPVNAY